MIIFYNEKSQQFGTYMYNGSAQEELASYIANPSHHKLYKQIDLKPGHELDFSKCEVKDGVISEAWKVYVDPYQDYYS